MGLSQSSTYFVGETTSNTNRLSIASSASLTLQSLRSSASTVWSSSKTKQIPSENKFSIPAVYIIIHFTHYLYYHWLHTNNSHWYIFFPKPMKNCDIKDCYLQTVRFVFADVTSYLSSQIICACHHLMLCPCFHKYCIIIHK